MLKICLLGPPKVTLNEDPVAIMRSDRVIALLAYLVVEHDQPQRREKLAGLLWPDFTENSARSNLRRGLADLRKGIGDETAAPPYLLTTRQAIQFNRNSPSRVDVNEFNQHTLTARKVSEQAIQDWEAALELYRGDFMEGFSLPDSQPYEEWLLLTREQLKRKVLACASGLVEGLESRGEIKRAMPFAWRQLDLDPTRESAHRQLMRLLALNGQRDEALAQYEACAKTLSKELGVETSAETDLLYQQILNGDWPQAAPEKTVITTRQPRQTRQCPYLGLASFKEKDAAFFFGREKFVNQLVVTLNQHPGLIAILGSSGSGKSSVVNAGLLPHLKSRGDWISINFRPGAHPIYSLSAALLPLIEVEFSETDLLIESQKLSAAHLDGTVTLQQIFNRILDKNPGKTKLLLYIDQFEEVYTLCTDQTERNRFLDELLNVSGSKNTGRNRWFNILLTMRADFMGQALAYRPFADALQGGARMLGPMTREEMQRAIESPADLQGAAFDDGLVTRLLNDIGDEPGNLPLLEFCLTLLWEQAEHGWLTHKGYEQIGHVQGALARYADMVHDELQPINKLAARQVFLQLIHPGDGTEDTCRRATRAEIGEDKWGLVQHLADKRLIVTSQSAEGIETAELVHEALIGHWKMLQGWIDEDRSFRTWQEGIRNAYLKWLKTEKDEGALLRGVPLAEAGAWLEGRRAELSEEEILFIESSIELQQRRESEREEQRQRELKSAHDLAKSEHRRRNILLVFSGFLTIAIIAAVFLTVYSLQQRSEALEAYSVNLAANAQNYLESGDSASALALALSANEIPNPPAAAKRVLLDAAYSPGARDRRSVSDLYGIPGGTATVLNISPDGQTALVGVGDGTILQVDPETLEEVRRLEGHAGEINDIVFHPRGTHAISAGDDGLAIVWDLRTGSEAGRFTGHTGAVQTVDIDQAGDRVISGSFAGQAWDSSGELILWDINTGAEIKRFDGHVSGVVEAEFALDDQAVLASSGDAALMTSIGPTESAGGGARQYTDLILWDLSSGQILQTYENITHDASSLEVSPDGAYALAGSYYEKLISVLNINSGEIIMSLVGSLDAITAVAYIEDGSTALAGSQDGAIMLWDVGTGDMMAHIRVHEGEILDAAPIRNKRQVLSTSADGTMILWDQFDAQNIAQYTGHEDMVYDVALLENEHKMLSAPGSGSLDRMSLDTYLRLWDLETGQQLGAFNSELYGAVFQVAISPDGETALFVGSDPFIHIFDLGSWQGNGSLAGHAGSVNCIEYLPDGAKALSCSSDGTMILWDLKEGVPIYQMDAGGQEAGLWALAISPDGRTALSDSGDSSMILWDLETGEAIRNYARDDYAGMYGSSGIAFSPDGRTAVSAESDGYIILWDVESGDELGRLGVHLALRTRVAFTPDGQLVVSAGMDGSIMVWDIESGELIRQTGGHGVIFDITMSPDGRSVYYGSSNMNITEWRISNPSLDELLAWIQQNRYVRELTCVERELYQIEPLCPGND